MAAQAYLPAVMLKYRYPSDQGAGNGNFPHVSGTLSTVRVLPSKFEHPHPLTFPPIRAQTGPVVLKAPDWPPERVIGLAHGAPPPPELLELLEDELLELEDEWPELDDELELLEDELELLDDEL